MGYNATVNTKGLWHLDNALTDSSGNGYTLSSVGSPGYAAAKFGNGIDLGATNTTKSIYINNAMGIQAGDQTCIAWYNIYSLPASDNTLMQKSWDAGNPGTNSQWAIELLLTSTGLIYAMVIGNPIIGGSTIEAVSVGRFNMVGYTWKNSTATLNVYINGVNKKSFIANTGVSANYANLFIVGGEGDRGTSVPSRNFLSAIGDEVILENRTWSDDEMLAYYASCLASIPSISVSNETGVVI